MSLLLIALGLGQVGYGQERSGLAHSNYAGTDAGYLNPARTAGQWPWMDIRLLGADVFAWNSLVAWSGRSHPLLDDVKGGFRQDPGGTLVLRSNNLSRTHRAGALAHVLGPAVSVALGRGTIGVGIRSRAEMSASGVSEELGNFMYEGLNYAPQHGVRYNDTGVRLLAAAWTEVGLNYAHILKAEGFGLLSAGGGLKYNIAHAAGAFQITALDYTVHDTARVDVHEATARYGFVQPAMNAGRGFGADLGVVYERTLDEAEHYRPHKGGSGCTPMRYRYRIGLSLIDLGGLRFGNAEAGTISAGSLSIPDYDNLRVRGTEGVDSLLATSSKWTRSNSLAVGLPTAMSLQYDQRIADHAYVAMAVVHSVAGRNSMRLRRTNTISITPRYETRYAEIALPVTVHENDFLRPSIGAMVRFHGLVVGTDRLMPFISKRDVHALDLYFRIRWLIFRSPACKGKGGGSLAHRSGAKDMVPCATPGDK